MGALSQLEGPQHGLRIRFASWQGAGHRAPAGEAQCAHLALGRNPVPWGQLAGDLGGAWGRHPGWDPVPTPHGEPPCLL